MRTVYPTPAFSLDDIPDQSGKAVLITGANAGIGKVMATELARRGAHVLVGARTEAKAEETVASILGETGAEAGLVEPLVIELGSLASVKAAADVVKAKDAPLDTLILNAGVMAAPFSLTKDGYESQFGVNHLGHFALVTALVDKLKAAPAARVVAVSSMMHQHGYAGGVRGLFTEHFAVAINDESEYSPWSAYGQSKLCNILMMRELAKRLEGTRVSANAAHPGYVATSLQRHIPSFLSKLAYALLALSPEDGALTPLFLATSERVESESIRGQYFTPIAQAQPLDEELTDPAIASKLWSQSEKLVAEVLEEPDPDKYFVGKKSSKDDGRRARMPTQGSGNAGAGEAVGCTQEGECSGDGGGGNVVEESSSPKSRIVTGPGGAKWESEWLAPLFRAPSMHLSDTCATAGSLPEPRWHVAERGADGAAATAAAAAAAPAVAQQIRQTQEQDH